ncbi:hypothetical protein ACFONN_19420 [Dyella humi]|uniref:Uncharacterized protein n=1 Tax=Dyella humi TaxID=1770547 RepID=A0ABW8IFJ5_9GAMM
MPFTHNLLLLKAHQGVIPTVLRDFGDMRVKIGFLLKHLKEFLTEAKGVKVAIDDADHGDDCDACVYLRNVALRLDNDLGLQAIHLGIATRLWENITHRDVVNAAETTDFLSLALSTRGILDSTFRSSLLYWKMDIRLYNKQLAESLDSLRKLKWSSMGAHLDDPALVAALDQFAALSNRLKQDSTLYADPQPTFKGKVDHFRKEDKVGLEAFFGECDEFYSALSDMVHGGTASMLSAVPPGPQIVLASDDLRFVASAHHLAELIGVTLVLAHKLLTMLYLPLLEFTLRHVEGAGTVAETVQAIASQARSRTQNLSF